MARDKMMTSETFRVSGLKPTWMVTPFTARELLFTLLTQRSASSFPLTWTSSSSPGRSYHVLYLETGLQTTFPLFFSYLTSCSFSISFASSSSPPRPLYSPEWLMALFGCSSFSNSYNFILSYVSIYHLHWWNLKILNPSLNLLPI